VVFLFIVLFGKLVYMVQLILNFFAKSHNTMHHIVDHDSLVELDSLNKVGRHLFWWFDFSIRPEFRDRSRLPRRRVLINVASSRDSWRPLFATPFIAPSAWNSDVLCWRFPFATGNAPPKCTGYSCLII